MGNFGPYGYVVFGALIAACIGLALTEIERRRGKL